MPWQCRGSGSFDCFRLRTAAAADVGVEALRQVGTCVGILQRSRGVGRLAQGVNSWQEFRCIQVAASMDRT